MDSSIESMITEYRSGRVTRRFFFERLIAVMGSYAAAYHLLETRGLAMPLLSPAESDDANLESKTVKIPGEGMTLIGYLSRPKGKGPFPGVISIHDHWGLNEHNRDIARRLASEGYVALAVDLLSRQGGTAAFPTEKVPAAFKTVGDDDVISDLNTAYKYLESDPMVQKNRIGVVGFCWGGQRSFLYATVNQKLKATVVFYGDAPPEDKLQQIQRPVLANYGELDERITSKVPAVEAAMKRLGKSFDMKIYPGAKHAFFWETGPNYHEEAAKDAWIRTIGFLKKNVG